MRLPGLLCLLLLAAPSALAAGTGFASHEVLGEGVTAKAQGTLDAAVGNASMPSLSVTGAGAQLLLVDEYSPQSVVVPFVGDDVGPVVHDRRRQETRLELASFALRLQEVSDGDARLLVIPDGAATTTLDAPGRYRSRSIQDEVIERSHAVAPGGDSAQWRYYEYRTGDSLELALDGALQGVVEGDFHVYLWGQTLSLEHAEGSMQVRTGSTREPTQQPVAPASSVVAEEHHRYAVLSVRGGSATFAQSAGPARLLTQSFQAAADGDVTFADARGSLATAKGRLEVAAGLVQAEGGDYRVSRDADRLAIDVLHAPATAVGTDAVFVAGPGGSAPPAWLLPAGIALAVLLLAGLYLYPSLRGAQTVRTGTGWSSRRADGFASMAASAESAGWPRLAAFWMGRSLRAVPADPLRMVDLAILRAQCGRLDDALHLHEAAHGWLVDAARGDHVAHNAYEAAKAASRLGQLPAALDWMRLAIEADPGLVPRAGREPAFAPLRDDPDFASMTVRGA